MAISTTTILGTDSISASRLTINDNFTVVKDEINSIETYLNPSTATVSGLTLLETSKLTVGPTSSPNLQLTTSAFDINMATTFKKPITQKQYGLYNNFYSTGTTYALKASTNNNASETNNNNGTASAGNDATFANNNSSSGNSGGPLLDQHGLIIGINEVGIGSLGGAIPSNLAKKIADEL